MVLCLLFQTSCDQKKQITDISDEEISDEEQVSDWLAYGRTHNERRFGPMADINVSNVKNLKVDWYMDLPNDVGLVSTPFVAFPDVYCLLGTETVQKFIGTKEYYEHKETRFPKADFSIPVAENEAFLINDAELRNSIKERVKKISNLYYSGQPDFEDLLKRIKDNIDKL